MQNSQAPARIGIAWAASATSQYVRTVSVESMIGVEDGAASYTTGFPPLNFKRVAAGGVPPIGKDLNGVLRDTTAHNRWQDAGGAASYDAAFSATVGGYPANCILRSKTIPGKFWTSTVDNNTTDPEGASPANWVSWTAGSGLGATYSGGVAISINSNDIDLDYTKLATNPPNLSDYVALFRAPGSFLKSQLSSILGLAFPYYDIVLADVYPTGTLAFGQSVPGNVLTVVTTITGPPYNSNPGLSGTWRFLGAIYPITGAPMVGLFGRIA